jgi:hypothetical protein
LRRTTRRLVLSLTRVTSSRRCFMLLCQACGLQLSYDLPEFELLSRIGGHLCALVRG